MYLMSYLPYELVIEGILIPKKGYSQVQLQSGKQEVIELSADQLKTLRANNVFADYEKTKKVRLMKECPTWALSAEARLSKLEAENKKLKSNDQIKVLTAEKESIISEATTAISSRDERIAELEAELEALKNKKE